MLRPIDTGSACRGQVLGQCSRSSPGTGCVGLASPPARSVAAGEAGRTGTALSGWRRSGVGRRARCADGGAPIRGRPCDAGSGASARCWNWRPPAWWAASRLSAGGGGPRPRRGGACVGHHLSGPVQCSPAQDACATPSVARGLGRSSPPATPASPPRRNSACHGGRSACGSEGTVKLQAQLPHHCPPQGFPGPPCPSPENRTRGGRRRQWAGGTPRQQER